MNSDPFRIAVVTTAYYATSHADVIVSRWLEPRPTDPQYGWESPQTRIASMYVEQQNVKDHEDLSAEKARRFGIPIYKTVREALTLGGDTLAVDAVILIGEHGDYPTNEFHQKMYPRKRLFDDVVAVFESSGRSVPFFFDKHLSWDVDAVAEMSDRIRRDRLPFFGGSSTPFTPAIPEFHLPKMPDFEEIVAIYFAALEPYLFHSLEWVESLIEKRSGGETGVREIIAWQDDAVWNAMDRGELSADLLTGAGAAVLPDGGQVIRELREKRGKPVYAFQLRYHDGLKVTHFMINDGIKKFCLAGRLRDAGGDFAAVLGTEGVERFFPHFARFCRKIEDFFLTGIAPNSPSRLYLTSTATALCMHALAQPGVPLATPQLVIPE